MDVPKYNEMYGSVLEVIKDGNEYRVKDVKNRVAEIRGLDEEALTQPLHNGKGTAYNDRLSWTRAYLKKAGLISSPRWGYIQITDEGKKVLKSGVKITNELLCQKYPVFDEWFNRPSTKSSDKTDQKKTPPAKPESDETPQEMMGRAYEEINKNLVDDLLELITKLESKSFEKLVVDLMKAMDYGNGHVTPLTRDGGIDGIIPEDKLGFSLIYIQAKCWDRDKKIERKEIQNFVGAMMGPPKIDKGLFITTAKFTDGAIKYANAQHIILIDGKRLAELMIEHNLGVSIQNSYEIKQIDSIYFDEDL